MPRFNGVTLSFVMALLVVGALPLAAMRFCTPARAQAQHDNDDRFPVGTTQHLPFFDPRWSNVRLDYSLVDGDKVMVEGDIVLGTETEVLRQSFANAVTAAAEAIRQDALMKALPSDKVRNDIRGLAGRPPNALQNTARPMLDGQVKDAVDAVAPLLGLRPVNPPQTEAEAQAVAVLAGRSCVFRWPGGLIPYEIAEEKHRGLILGAIKHWEKRTNWIIRFDERNVANAQQYSEYVHFKKGARDCYAYPVGRRPGLGAHWIALHDGCGEPQVIHEIGHIVGLYHEHCRADSERWIEIDYTNMKEDAQGQFARMEWMDARILTAFDFWSVMMYPFEAFAVDPTKAPTIRIKKGVRVPVGSGVRIPKNPADFGLKTGKYGGKTVGLSDLDVEGIKKMYLDKPCGNGQ
jgi:hypothetical protein